MYCSTSPVTMVTMVIADGGKLPAVEQPLRGMCFAAQHVVSGSILRRDWVLPALNNHRRLCRKKDFASQSRFANPNQGLCGEPTGMFAGRWTFRSTIQIAPRAAAASTTYAAIFFHIGHGG